MGMRSNLESDSSRSQHRVDSRRFWKSPKFTISVLCFNHVMLTAKCLESIMRHSGEDFELFITNNASEDGTAGYLAEFKRRFDHVARIVVITNEQNKGFQEPNEYVLTKARGEYFVLLNNDMECCEGWLDSLVKPFDNPKMGITGAAGTCCRLNDKFQAIGGEPVEYIEGSCLMVPTALVRLHGLFSKYLKFIYWEDTDLSFRFREMGYEIQTVKIDMKHRHPSSTTKHMDLREVKEHNAAAFKSRWSFYVKRRSFKRRVLIRRLGARGDVLLLTPVLRALRNKWPQAEIQVLTKCPQMIAGMDGIALAKSRRTYFDNIYDLDLSYEARPEVHIVQAYADKLEVRLPARWNIEMFPSEADMVWGLRRSRGLKVALIHGGHTTWPGKNWPVDRMAELVDYIKSLGYFTIAVGAEDSPRCGCSDDVTGKTTPQQMYALARHASLFVGLDSMPQHVMSAANVPSVVVFGPTNPKMIVRPSPRIIPVQATVQDAACVGEHGRRTVAVTQAPCEGDCMKAVSVFMMRKAVDRLIAMTK